MARALHHLALGARDVDALARFYRDVLGLAERTRHQHADGTLRSVWLEVGDGAVLMVEAAASLDRAPVEGVGQGLFLLTVRVTAEERPQLEAALAAAGCPVESRTAATSYARDPEGNRVAISHHPLT